MISLGDTNIISEPSADNNGNIVFMTGNTWAARSTDTGESFSFVDPSADFPKVCCDQDVIFSEEHGVWIWYRQGDPDPDLLGGFGRNQVKISASTDALTWCTITFTATDIDVGMTDHLIDYPQLQITENKLYISTNFFDFDSSDGFTNFTGMLRFNLSDMASCGPSFPFQTILVSDNFNFTMVNGAIDTMYFGTQQDDGASTKIFSWEDTSPSTDLFIVTYPAYAAFTDEICIVNSTNSNPCDRSDPRITGGYIKNDVLGFVWDAAQGGAFVWPYVNYITVNATSESLISNTPFFSPTNATNFSNMGITKAGDIGIGLFQMGGETNPTFLVGINDSLTGPNEFDFSIVKTSSHGPGSDVWGDYIRIKPSKPDNGQFIGTGFTMQGGTTNSDVENLFVTFGRNPSCLPPGSGDWVISSSCYMPYTPSNPSVNNGDLIVQNNSVLIIPSGVSLNIDFNLQSIIVESGSGILIKSGAVIT